MTILSKKINEYMMNEFKGGKNVVEVTKDTLFDVISQFEKGE